MLHNQKDFVQSRTLTPGPLSFELEPINHRGFVSRIRAVTAAELAGVDLSYLDRLAEQQRREGGAS